MPLLAIIFPSGNSTSLSILPHKSTPPAPVIISLLLSELSRVCQYLNKIPQTEGSSPPEYRSNYLPIRGMAYAKKDTLALWMPFWSSSSFLTCGHFSGSEGFLCNCYHCTSSLPTTCSRTKIGIRQDLLSASPPLLQDSPFWISSLHV